MKAKSRSILLITSAILFVAVLIYPVGLAFGWYTVNREANPIIDPVPTTVTTAIRFEGSQEEFTKDHLIDVDVTDANADKALTKLRVSVTVNSSQTVMLRLYVYPMWTDNGVTVNRGKITFAYNSEYFFDNTATDDSFWYYYNPSGGTGAQPFELDTDGTARTFSIITGLNQTTRYESTTKLQLQITASVVQANRYEQFWGALPIVTPTSR